jgi:D-alanine transfer protein
MASGAATSPGRGAGGDGGDVRAARLPVGIVAAGLALALAVVAGSGIQILARRESERRALAFAGAPAPVKTKALSLQRAALADPNVLPVYGSSELYCCGDPYRPTQLFVDYRSGFDAFAVGRAGVGNLIFAETFGALGGALRGRKIAIVDSPHWFAAPPDYTRRSYSSNFSHEIAARFVFTAPVSLELRAAVVRQMLDHPDTLEGDTILRLAVQALARPSRLRLAGYWALVPLGRIEGFVDDTWDAAWTLMWLSHPRFKPSPAPSAAASLDWSTLVTRATAIEAGRDTTNPFGFSDVAFRKMMQQGENARFREALAAQRAGTSNRDGTALPEPTAWEQRLDTAPEWTNLRLAVAVLHELGAEPIVLTVPMPGFYANNTAFSSRVRAHYYDHFERTAARTGAPWIDFRAEDEDPWFVTDTGGHLSPRGWIFANRALDMFWHDRPLDEIRTALDDLARTAPPPVVVAAAGAARAEGAAR